MAIRIIKNTPNHVVFEKDDRKESWFNHNCSDENLLQQCGRSKGWEIDRIKFDDRRHIASILNVYLKVK